MQTSDEVRLNGNRYLLQNRGKNGWWAKKWRTDINNWSHMPIFIFDTELEKAGYDG